MTWAQLLQTLRPSERDAVHAVYVDRLPLADAAERMSIDEATLGSVLASAFAMVARCIEDPGDESTFAGRSHWEPTGPEHSRTSTA